MICLLFTFLLATHYTGKKTARTAAFAFKLCKFLVKFFLLTGKRLWCNNFYPDQQIARLPTALHAFSCDFQGSIELDTGGDFQLNMTPIYRFNLDRSTKVLPAQD